MTRILAISGSLRRESTNTTLLQAARLLAPTGVSIERYKGLGHLPLFNPDIEGPELDGPTPPPVQDFRDRLNTHEGVLIASPEYAHGVTGAIKNALDWVVASGEFVGKPVALLNASPRAHIALEALAETITVMDARLVREAGASLQILGSGLDAAGIAADPQMAETLRESLRVFVEAIGSA